MLNTRFYQEAMPALVEIRNEFEQSGNIILLAHLRKLSARMMMAQAGEGIDWETQVEAAIMSLRQAASLCEYQEGVCRETGITTVAKSLPPGESDLSEEEPLEHARLDTGRAAFFHKLSARMLNERTLGRVSAPLTNPTTGNTSPNSAPGQPDHHNIDEFALATLRLQDAAFSRDYLFYELAAILQENFGASTIIVLQRNQKGRFEPQCFRGCSAELALTIGAAFTNENNGGKHFITGDNYLCHHFRDGADELVVWLDKGQTTLKRTVFASLCKHVELTLAVSRQQAANLVVNRKLLETGRGAKDGMIYQSDVMHAVIEQIKMLSGSQTTILLLGESGTGKELAARAIHRHSIRADKSFVAYNCSSIPKEIAESEMFGHRKGAFTGAHQDSLGIFRSAEGGTLFLDEIGDLPLEIQPKLLRFLENGEVRPVGTSLVITTDIKVVAATNQDLDRMVAEGRFRADLWYRISPITIKLPPLRERKGDIPLLVQHLLGKLSLKEGKQGIRLAHGFFKELMSYNWPGNIRELANVVKQIVVFTPSFGVIESLQFAPYLRQELSPAALPALVTTPQQLKDGDIQADLMKLEVLSTLTLGEALFELEQKMIKSALAYHHNNISRAAVTLGLSRYGLQRKLKRFSHQNEAKSDLVA